MPFRHSLARHSCVAVLCGLLLAVGVRAEEDLALREAVAGAVAARLGAWPRRDAVAVCGESVRRLYADRAHDLMWVRDRMPTSQAAAVIDRLRRAAVHGLDAGEYGVVALESLQSALRGGAVATAEVARFEVSLSIAVACYAEHLHGGRVRPRQVGFALDGRAPLDLVALVAAVSRSDRAGDILESVAPPRPEYRWLVAALDRYRALGERLDGIVVPALPKLEPGDVDPSVSLLRARLRDTGDLPVDGAAPVAEAAGGTPDPARYDEELAVAVRRFQNRHGLTEDAVVGPRTLAALRVPMSVRVRQIELALERWRWLPRPDRRSVVVNVPEFRVRVHEPGIDTPVLAMKVVVGSAANKTRTAVFAAEMRYLVFRPFWHVPRSIALGEMLPAASRNAGYLRGKRIEAVGDAPLSRDALASGAVRLRQKPGPGNSLGLIKFMFPNRYSIYMHDTPAKNLFRHARRDFSHGCIRLEDAHAMATLLLADQGWDAERVTAATQGRDSQRVDLDTPVPVSVFYVTAVAAPDGETWFYEDLYGHDMTLDRLLRGAAR
jgi:L,D-transpeptidase YcbB